MTATVLVGRERRRWWTTAQKLLMVEESFAPGASVAAVARRHEVHPNQLHGWRRDVLWGKLSAAWTSRKRGARGEGHFVTTTPVGLLWLLAHQPPAQ